MTQTPTTEPMLSVTQLAELLVVPVQTIYAWRKTGEGPVGYRIGRHVRYYRVDVDRWLEQRRDSRVGVP